MTDVAQKASEVLMFYNAMNLHFSPSSPYDYAKYKGRLAAPKKDIKKHKNYWQLIGLYKKFDFDPSKLQQFMYTCHRSKNCDFGYIGLGVLFLLSRKIDLTFDQIVTKAISELDMLLDQDLRQCDELYPIIYNKYQDGEIMVETLLIYDRYISRVLKPELSIDIVRWPVEIKNLERIASLFFYLFDEGHESKLEKAIETFILEERLL